MCFCGVLCVCVWGGGGGGGLCFIVVFVMCRCRNVVFYTSYQPTVPDRHTRIAEGVSMTVCLNPRYNMRIK